LIKNKVTARKLSEREKAEYIMLGITELCIVCQIRPLGQGENHSLTRHCNHCWDKVCMKDIQLCHNTSHANLDAVKIT
jgi:hypothetical protein